MVRWSYDLLSPTEQETLSVLSIFRGTCTAAAIEAVALDVPEVDDVLDALVDKSLLQLDASKNEPRYRLLEVVRDYAREQLTIGADETARARHAAYYAGIVAAAGAPYLGLDDDVPNLRVALDWLLANNAESAGRFIEDLAPYWRASGAVNEARAWIRRALEAYYRAATRQSAHRFFASPPLSRRCKTPRGVASIFAGGIEYLSSGWGSFGHRTRGFSYR